MLSEHLIRFSFYGSYVHKENVFRLGTMSGDRERSGPIRSTVPDIESKRRVLHSPKSLKNVEGYSNVLPLT